MGKGPMRRTWRDLKEPKASVEPKVKRKGFPLAMFFFAGIALTGFYYQLFIDIPHGITSGSHEDLSNEVLTLFEMISLTLGSTPVLAFLLFIAIMAPGFFYPQASRQYFLTITLMSLTLWTACFIVTEEPAKRLGTAIHDMLSMDRNLPDLLE